ncbi:MAG: hydrogenase [Pseudomonadota bacterium]
MNLSLIRHGYILFLLSLLSAFFIPVLALPRLGLSAHTAGIMGAIMMVLAGIVWPHIKLTAGGSKAMCWSWLYAGYANWFGSLVGAVFGAGKTTPLAAAGAIGPQAAELAVLFLLGTVGIVSLVAVGLTLWGLRGGNAA